MIEAPSFLPRDGRPRFAGEVLEPVRQAPRRRAGEARAVSADELEDLVLAAQMEERQRLAGELHDSVGHNLVALTLSLGRLRSASQLPSELRPIIEEMSEFLHKTHAEIRTLSFLLQPPWEDDDVETALRDLAAGFARRAGLAAEVQVEPLGFSPCSSQKLTLYRILQEALVNVHRHARASAVTVELVRRGGHIVLTVRDNGRGMPGLEGEPPNVGVGIENMRVRLRKLGGDLRIVSHSQGTTVLAKLPA